MTLAEYIKIYWPVFFSVLTIIISITAQWAVFGIRLTAMEERQNRQGEAITEIRAQQSMQAAQYAALNAKLDTMNDTLNYLRSRVDRSLP